MAVAGSGILLADDGWRGAGGEGGAREHLPEQLLRRRWASRRADSEAGFWVGKITWRVRPQSKSGSARGGRDR